MAENINLTLLRNKEFQIRAGEFEPDNYAEFSEALDLMEALRKEGVLRLAYALMGNYRGVTPPISQIETRGGAEGIPYSLLYLISKPVAGHDHSLQAFKTAVREDSKKRD